MKQWMISPKLFSCSPQHGCTDTGGPCTSYQRWVIFALKCFFCDNRDFTFLFTSESCSLIDVGSGLHNNTLVTQDSHKSTFFSWTWTQRRNVKYQEHIVLLELSAVTNSRLGEKERENEEIWFIDCTCQHRETGAHVTDVTVKLKGTVGISSGSKSHN